MSNVLVRVRAYVRVHARLRVHERRRLVDRGGVALLFLLNLRAVLRGAVLRGGWTCEMPSAPIRCDAVGVVVDVVVEMVVVVMRLLLRLWRLGGSLVAVCSDWPR